MSQNTTSRRTKPYRVDAKSVPSCLYHESPATVLDDARNLAAFLEEAVANMFTSGNESSDGFRGGLTLAFALLQDKLAIASGKLAFPLATLFPDEADGVLWTEPQGGEDE